MYKCITIVEKWYKEKDEVVYTNGTERKVTKSELWKEFKDIWEIDVLDYNENKYNEMILYINETTSDNKQYFKDYPRDFFEYREDSNYHSYDSYSVIEQFEICQEWECYQEEKGNYSDDYSDDCSD